MISVQSLRQLLSGNRYYLFLLIPLLISSCSVAKKATENKDVQIVNAGTKPTDNQVVNKKGSEPGLKIDTIKWSDTSSKNAPIM